MSIADLSRKMEITFWDWAIPTLTVSPLVQKCVCLFYHVFRKNPALSRVWIGIAVSLFGFSNGLLVYWFFVR
jgi:hypothetical protein